MNFKGMRKRKKERKLNSLVSLWKGKNRSIIDIWSMCIEKYMLGKILLDAILDCQIIQNYFVKEVWFGYEDAHQTLLNENPTRGDLLSSYWKGSSYV